MKINTKIKSHIKAFTLIELLVVVAVIGLLSSIVYASVSTARGKASDIKIKTQAYEVMKSVELYQLSANGRVPIFSGSTPGIMVKEGSTGYNEAMGKLVSGGYLASIPTSSNGDSYAYMTTADGKAAVFVANTKLQSPVCLIYGTANFGRTGSGNSCEGIVAENYFNNAGNDLACGDEPYSVKIGQTGPDTNGYYTIDIDAIDPEGQNVFYSNLMWSPMGGAECSASVSGSFPINMTCFPYVESYLDILFDLYTEGCASQQGGQTLQLQG